MKKSKKILAVLLAALTMSFALVGCGGSSSSSGSSEAPKADADKVYNIGNSAPENLLDFVTILQEELIAAKVLPSDYDFEAHKELVAMQPGDVPVTFADTTPLEEDFGFRPSTPLRDGLRAFAQWYAKYYGTAE